MPSIVLVSPLIPQNTGSIARLTAANGVNLHLVEPLGFELSDRYLKRAGLDYWAETKITVHASWEKFLASTEAKNESLWFFTTKASVSHYEVEFQADDYLVFGNESIGLREEFHDRYPERKVKIPMTNENVRSLNLANSVSIGLYEALRTTYTYVKPRT